MRDLGPDLCQQETSSCQVPGQNPNAAKGGGAWKQNRGWGDSELLGWRLGSLQKRGIAELGIK